VIDIFHYVVKKSDDIIQSCYRVALRVKKSKYVIAYNTGRPAIG